MVRTGLGDEFVRRQDLVPKRDPQDLRRIFHEVQILLHLVRGLCRRLSRGLMRQKECQPFQDEGMRARSAKDALNASELWCVISVSGGILCIATGDSHDSKSCALSLSDRPFGRVV